MSHSAELKPLFYNFAALMVLLAITIGMSYVDLGAFNLFVALLIAGIKTFLVALIFMNLRSTSNVSRLAAVGGLLWLGFALILTAADYHSRGWNEAQAHDLIEVEQARP
ncbi:MAG: Caa(3)-type oxidase subunit IV [Planctomyces sp.]|nr:Caa(3)-type oxidase subunit IV [Planctomyces sp.]